MHRSKSPPVGGWDPEYTKLVHAKWAYEYAFEHHEGLRWSMLATMLSNIVARAAFTIPLAGYLILYSDYFQSMFQSTHLTPTWGLLTLNQRINFMYYGSVLLLGTYIYYLIASPPLLRNKTSVHQFVGDILTSNDYATVSRVLQENIKMLSSLEMTKLSDAQAVRLSTLGEQMEKVVKRIQFSRDPDNIIPNALRFYYEWRDSDIEDDTKIWFGIFLSIIGYSLLLLPAVDLFIRVLQKTVGLA